MIELPESLRESIAEKRLVPFVGAGVSNSILRKDGTPALPTWLELLERGASALRKDGKGTVAKLVESSIEVLATPNAVGMDPIALAGMIRTNLGPRGWANFLRNELDPDSATIDDRSLDLPKKIWALASDFVITTNFDRVLTWTCPRRDDVRNLDLDDSSGLAESLSENFKKPTIWHLHGYIDNPANLILTPDNYSQLYSAEKNGSQQYVAARVALESAFATRTMLFVGFSFADEYIKKQLEWLATTFAGYNRGHFALVRRSEMDKAEPILAKLQVRPIPFEDFGAPLVATVQAIAALKPNGPDGWSSGLLSSLAQDVSPPDAQPVPPDERWRTTRAVRLMDQLGPTYILDRGYFFLDWNPAFERLFAEPLGLYRGQHAQDFVLALANRGVVEARARQVFQPEALPLVDMEPLFFESKEFGLIEMWKIASRIIDDDGNLAAWAVALNIVNAGNLKALWEAVRRVLDARVNWALYAPSYDKLVLNFDEYDQLTKFVCSKLDGAKQCADLGAGTGNGTIQLLRQQADRIVWAIDPHEEMMRRLRSKVAEEDPALAERVHFIKQGLRSLGGIEDSYFDGAIMINVLYAVDNPADCLKEVARVMQPDGVLALSTAHSETDVDRLFAAIRQNLAKRGLLGELRATLKEARARHESMMDKIHRDTKADIRNYLTQAGFRIEEWHDDQYAGAVVVVKAVKM